MGSFAMKLDKAALAILMTTVCNYKWRIKCGECNVEVLTSQTLAFCYMFKTKFHSNVYDEGI
jgi:hypothetical protein